MYFMLCWRRVHGQACYCVRYGTASKYCTNNARSRSHTQTHTHTRERTCAPHACMHVMPCTTVIRFFRYITSVSACCLRMYLSTRKTHTHTHNDVNRVLLCKLAYLPQCNRFVCGVRLIMRETATKWLCCWDTTSQGSQMH